MDTAQIYYMHTYIHTAQIYYIHTYIHTYMQPPDRERSGAKAKKQLTIVQQFIRYLLAEKLDDPKSSVEQVRSHHMIVYIHTYIHTYIHKHLRNNIHKHTI